MAILEIENFTKQKIHQELLNRNLLDTTNIFFLQSLNNENSTQLINRISSANESIFLNLEVDLGINQLKEIVEDEIKIHADYSLPLTQDNGDYCMDFCELIDKDITQNHPCAVRFGIFYKKEEQETYPEFAFLTSTYKFFELFISIQLDIHKGQKIRIGMNVEGKDFYEFINTNKESIRFEITKSTGVINILYKILPLF